MSVLLTFVLAQTQLRFVIHFTPVTIPYHFSKNAAFLENLVGKVSWVSVWSVHLSSETLKPSSIQLISVQFSSNPNFQCHSSSVEPENHFLNHFANFINFNTFWTGTTANRGLTSKILHSGLAFRISCHFSSFHIISQHFITFHHISFHFRSPELQFYKFQSRLSFKSFQKSISNPGFPKLTFLPPGF